MSFTLTIILLSKLVSMKMGNHGVLMQFKIMVQIAYIFILALLLCNFVAESKNRCLQEGVAWNWGGHKRVFAPSTLQQCQQSYEESEEAEGFTWYGPNYEVIPNWPNNVCVLFDELEGEHKCTIGNCISSAKSYGQNNESCLCNQQKGECRIDKNNFIAVSYTNSESECILQCSAAKDCYHYTWYSKDSQTMAEECFLFSSCNNVDICTNAAGCFTGSLNCVGFDLGCPSDFISLSADPNEYPEYCYHFGCSTCPLVFCCWELSHVIFFKLRKKELLAKLRKFTK